MCPNSSTAPGEPGTPLQTSRHVLVRIHSTALARVNGILSSRVARLVGANGSVAGGEGLERATLLLHTNETGAGHKGLMPVINGSRVLLSSTLQ